jgi:MFS transporter, putative metabolite:H+ symporter
MSEQADRVRSNSRIRFRHPVAFWLATACCTVGVLLHLPMYYDARSMGYRMSGMTPDASMIIGMALIVIGLVVAVYALVPSRATDIRRQAAVIRVRALDEAPIRRQHVALLLVLALAVTIDVMKPITLSFVSPGVAHEYGLRPADPHSGIPVAWLPFFGIAGTVVGSWMWGSLGDRIGRRASILLAGLLFTTTSICGAMPGFSWNLFMCFMMGIGVGGLFPVGFTLLAETIPARHRGWLMVLIGGNTALAYVLVSWLAATLTPTYSWRILWLIGLPTGLLLIGLNRWIPESPRFLLARGERAAAQEIMAYYGAAEVEPAAEAAAPEPAEPARGRIRDLLRRPFGGPTLAITVLGLGVGLVAYGFQLWVPTNLQKLGYTAVASDYVVRNAAVIGLPFTVLLAWMYGAWGSRRTIVAAGAATAAALAVFAVEGGSLAHHRALLSLLLVLPLSAIGTITAVVAGYAAEVYPTRIRSRGTGWAAGMTKAGGILILAVAVSSKSVPSLSATALIGVVPLVLAVVAFVFIGPETRRRPLDEISRVEGEGVAVSS